MRVLPASLAAAVALLAFAGPALPAAPTEGPPPQVLPPGIRGGSEVTPEPRVAIHHYTFAPTGESLPYSVFVSSRIKPGEKAPLLLAIGEDDFLIDGVRAFHRQLDEQGIRHDYLEKPGLDHGTIILGSMPDVFRFFPKHARP